MPGRAEEAAIERRYPGLIAGLVNHPGIDVVVVRSDRGLVAIGDTGTSFLDEGRVLGDDPLAPYGPLAADGLRRIAGFDAGGDLIAIGHVDPVTNEVVSFEELVGSHGGLGGEQERPFLAAPAAWPRLDPCPVGSPEVHRQLEAWIAALPARSLAGRRCPGDVEDQRRAGAITRSAAGRIRALIGVLPITDPVGLDELGGVDVTVTSRRAGAQDPSVGRSRRAASGGARSNRPAAPRPGRPP